MIFLGKVGVGISEEHLTARAFGQYDRVFLMLDEEDAFSGDTEILPETLCVSIRFRGGLWKRKNSMKSSWIMWRNTN